MWTDSSFSADPLTAIRAIDDGHDVTPLRSGKHAKGDDRALEAGCGNHGIMLGGAHDI